MAGTPSLKSMKSFGAGEGKGLDIPTDDDVGESWRMNVFGVQGG
jgi:hypothetical protein